MKRTFTLALMITGLNIFAGEPLLLNSAKGNDFFAKDHSLFSKKKMNVTDRFGFNTTAFSGSGKEWEEGQVTSGGFFLNLGIFIPSDLYFNPDFKAGDPTFKTGIDFEFGNFFRFAKFNDGMFGFGLRATWLSLSYTHLTDGPDKYWAGQISPVRVGPEISVAINETMGVDAFYDLGYNYSMVYGSVYSTALSTTSVGWSKLYAGISHQVGAAFHFKVFSVGLGYRFGKLTNFSNIYDSKDLTLDDKKSPVNNFRITLGFRF